MTEHHSEQTEYNDVGPTEPPERPGFATAIRGYDRLQVHDYIDRLNEIAADAEERARAAEEELEFSRHATVGPRVSEIFDLAVEESKELRERVAVEVEEQRAAARTDAQATVSMAEQEAAHVRARTESERRAAMTEIEELGRVKGALRTELERLQEALEAALDLAYDGGDETNTKELEPAPEAGDMPREESDARVA